MTHDGRMKTLLTTATLLLASTASSDSPDDPDRARQAMELGLAKPLVELLSMVERETKGHVVEVEFELVENAYMYEFEFIGQDGHLMEAVVDAKTGRILSVEADEDD